MSKVGSSKFGPSEVQIIDSVEDYLELLENIFDFALIKNFLHSHPEFRVLFDGLNGVTGPYAKAILIDTLELPESSVQNCIPLPDFGGGHPDPNLTYAHTLVEAVEENNIQFGAASDGDGDRNMIYGKSAFVTPSDSVAIIADWAHTIPYFKGGIKGLARSMPTSAAIDYVAKEKKVEVFEVPTGESNHVLNMQFGDLLSGWKFFGNLMDAGRLSICGEESFGTGSDHIREKDGIWAIVGESERQLCSEVPSETNGQLGSTLLLLQTRSLLTNSSASKKFSRTTTRNTDVRSSHVMTTKKWSQRLRRSS